MLRVSSVSTLCFVCFSLFCINLTSGECRFPRKKLENGRIIYQSLRDRRLRISPENYLLRFACYEGYTRKGSGSILCKSSKWSGGLPLCIKMQCSEPPRIQNGRYNWSIELSSSSAIYSIATYTCDEGYELENDTWSSLSCLLDRRSNAVTWNGEISGCRKKETCPDPGSSLDGKRAGGCCFKGDFLTFSCNDGYELIGSDTLECLTGGLWNSSRPLCRPMNDYCENPPAIPHGATIGEKRGDYYELYDEIEIICELGYVYEGPLQFVMCTETGWEEEFGECAESFCEAPEPLVNGKILEIASTNLTVFPFNFDLTYVCDSGYRLIGDSLRICDGGWSGETPHCQAIRCPDPGVPENGIRQGDNFAIGGKVLFKCFAGYELLGSFERYCQPNGQWSGELPSCDSESNYCPDPGIPINGMKNTSIYDVGVKVGFSCHPDFTLLGSEARECLRNRTWSGKEAKCLGPYDFDNVVQVSDVLKSALDKKMAEQEKRRKKFEDAFQSNALFSSGPVGRRIDLNYKGRLILYFVFDVSGSIRAKNFCKSIEFAKALVKRIGITESGNRAGAVTFSSASQIIFGPLQYETTDSVCDALDGIEYTGGGTSTNTALEQVRIELIPLSLHWLGKNSKSIIFILTDGKVNMGGNPQIEAEKLKDAGAEIYCIGITGKEGKKDSSLFNIASDPKSEHVFILQNYHSMNYLIQDITNGTIDYSQCGLGNDRFAKRRKQGRIAGGQDVAEPWPWMAALYFIPPGFFSLDFAELQCGGSIIHPNFILTAAHCLFTNEWEPRTKENVIVKLGLTNVRNEKNLQEFGVTRFIIHPKYKEEEFDYDIALLHLERPITFDAYIRPVCLPPIDLSENPPLYNAGEEAVATGWGHDGVVFYTGGLNAETKSVAQLKEIILPIQSNHSCNKSAVDNGALFTERMFCAGDGRGGGDTCKGDSGGPLMQSQLHSSGYTFWTEVGIVSWGFGCRSNNTYGYYTHVQKLLPWIRDNIKATTAASFKI